MGMTEHQHEVEGRLLVMVRKAIVSLERLQEFLPHHSSHEEARGRQNDLIKALSEYEEMMMEREGTHE